MPVLKKPSAFKRPAAADAAMGTTAGARAVDGQKPVNPGKGLAAGTGCVTLDEQEGKEILSRNSLDAIDLDTKLELFRLNLISEQD